MATESFGKTIYMDNDFADRYLAQLDKVNQNPPQHKSNIKWWDSAELSKRIKQAYGDKEE